VLAGLLVVVIALAGLGSRQASALDPANPHDRIALTALQYEGAWGGQCWQFMKDVVREATGAEIGFDYRQGYFEAGAVEVTDLAEVRAGDIIQVALDSWTSPDADYPGLHTSIVLTNLGDGTFDVIDSNQNWDEMVRLRPDYNPFEAAARYGLQVHIYRIPGDGSTANLPPSAVPPSGAEFAAGETGTVNTPGECLRLRTGGGLGEGIITCLPDGTRFTVIAKTVAVGGRHWAKIRTEAGAEGWVATEYVIKDSVPASSAGGGQPILQYRAVTPGVSAN
ncbi:MAG: SH3 domain-containing protein, partial [Tepidiformaceae bacterium]